MPRGTSLSDSRCNFFPVRALNTYGIKCLLTNLISFVYFFIIRLMKQNQFKPEGCINFNINFNIRIIYPIDNYVVELRVFHIFELNPLPDLIYGDLTH